jgi:hypothetical protein
LFIPTTSSRSNSQLAAKIKQEGTVTLTLDITPEVEAGLLAEAKLAGLPLDQFLTRQLETLAHAPAPRASESTGRAVMSDQLAQEFDEWLDSFPQGPVLSDEALNRENWYPDRW